MTYKLYRCRLCDKQLFTSDDKDPQHLCGKLYGQDVLGVLEHIGTYTEGKRERPADVIFGHLCKFEEWIKEQPC